MLSIIILLEHSDELLLQPSLVVKLDIYMLCDVRQIYSYKTLTTYVIGLGIVSLGSESELLFASLLYFIKLIIIISLENVI